ncbi:MAG: hypothetical protein V1754_14225 [Pseudomonadota bacterium]
MKASIVCMLVFVAAVPVGAITRDQTMARAKAYSFHPWHCSQANQTANCAVNYKSVYFVGDYVGLPYDWGGYMTIFEFDQQIAQGYGAGSYPADGVLSCTAGLDCSGFVSKCWDAGHYSTSTLHEISSQITQAEILAGDVFNQSGYHVVLFSHTLGNGDPIFYEAAGYNVHINITGGWSSVSGFTPRRYNEIQGTTTSNPLGTTETPIVIGTFPYTDSRNTTQSVSDVLDGCGASPKTGETGPEYIYEVTFATPGQITVSVSDDVGVDIDVHLYTSMNTEDCVVRHDTSFTHPVDCGTYYIVADTFGDSVGQSFPGAYTLNVLFSPSGQACGSGPPEYDPEGELGDPCAYPGHEDLPFCNQNLGSSVCLYLSGLSGFSFCTKPCSSGADCMEFAGGCCMDVGSGEYFCHLSNMCGSAGPDASVPDFGVSDGGIAYDSFPPGPDTMPLDGDITQGDASNTDGGGNLPPDVSGGCQCQISETGLSSQGLLFFAIVFLLRSLDSLRSTRARSKRCTRNQNRSS